MRLADEAVATSVISGVPLFFTTNATNVARLAVNTTVKIFRYVEKKLTDERSYSTDPEIQLNDESYTEDSEKIWFRSSWEEHHGLA